MTDTATTIHNERTKLTATYMNGLAIALAAIGGFAPAVSTVSSGGAPSGITVFVTICCIAGSLILHLVARRLLGRLK